MSSLNMSKKYWRSSNERRTSSVEGSQFLNREFLKGAAFLDEAVSRRHFLKLMGASAALMGAGCAMIRKPVRKIKPYSKSPEFGMSSQSLRYATSAHIGEDVVGVLATTSEGRPTKLEGNPLYPLNKGSLTAFYQASILSLYDPDRIKKGRRGSKELSQLDIDALLSDVSRRYLKTQGRGLSILMAAQVSPTVHSLFTRFKLQFPYARLHKYDPINTDNVKKGLYAVTNKSIMPYLQFEKADVIVSFDHDFLGTVSNNVNYTSHFSMRRSPEDNELNRLYMFESNYSVTGTRSDHRFKLRQSQVPLAILQLVDRLAFYGVISYGTGLRDLIQKSENMFVLDPLIANEIALDLINSKGRSLVTAGPMQPSIVHELVFLINQGLQNNGKTVRYYPVPFSDAPIVQKGSIESLSELIEAMSSGDVGTLIVLGGDPMFNVPADSKFRSLYQKIDETICFSMIENETTHLSQTVIPRQHFLESWGDCQSLSGVTSLVQPVIEPMGEGYSDVGFVARLIGDLRSDYALVRRTWRFRVGKALFRRRWEKWLHDGVISSDQKAVSVYGRRITSSLVSRLSSVVMASIELKGLELNFYEDYRLYDGRFSNNGWLQEMPDPITKLTWDNALLMSSRTAKKMGVKSQDVVKVVKGVKSLELPVYILPGHADNALSVSVGYGQKYGRVGKNVGINAYFLRHILDFDRASTVSLIKTNKRYELASTQEHGSMEGRALYREAPIDRYRGHPDFAKEMVETPPLKSLFDERPYDTGYQWGMSIDLSRCTGCNACVIACQSENNIPIVGKKEVLNGREMHWIRIDRYFEGDEDNPDVVDQPVTCLHCENAPCEQVCPVAATVHTQEGLNDMVYNRCVGTRYCADNCPVKVRRFNFFDYHQRNPQSRPKENRRHLFDYMKEPDPMVQRQFNPEVTVRMRGVMEKCTYCTQRISTVKIKAKNEGRLVKDGEIKTACQQTCPANAIVFGDILDPNSEVSKLKNRKREYSILEQLHLKARTTYLASITNPNPKILDVLGVRGS